LFDLVAELVSPLFWESAMVRWAVVGRYNAQFMPSEPVMPRIEVVGAYALDVTPKLIEEALRLKGHVRIDPRWRMLVIDGIRGELESVVLAEIIVHRPDKRFTIIGFGQSQTGKKKLASNDQAAYDEKFLSDDGTSIVEFNDELLHGKKIRLVFWLHFYRPTEILTCYDPVPAPSPSFMPERLARLMQYDPVT
jgi:hypothetical protein